MLFGESSGDAMVQSLQWEVYEQQAFWQLLCAEAQCPHHSMDVVQVVSQAVLHAVADDDPTEILSGISLLLRTEPPSTYLSKAVFSVDPSTHSGFVCCVLSQWLARDADLLTKVLQDTCSSVSDDSSAACNVISGLQLWSQKPSVQALDQDRRIMLCGGEALADLVAEHGG